ncbi:3-phosphoshikimate 1-carboxyvinyltransferase [Tropheryma whipplei]|uniref:3-phosphoshikimate 1-carboxyvinyltransferase n=1 Tax=Tropheryma whipplei TaxID=2039 RepID=UPI000694E9EF|nr:3-phosphoshikimate 1-carboxyvinyltransferase [Tropheryma whipplei]
MAKTEMYQPPLGNRALFKMSIPGSKSLTNRHLISAAIASGETTIHNLLESRDTNLMIEGLRRIGCKIEKLNHTGTHDTGVISPHCTCLNDLIQPSDVRIIPSKHYTCSTKIDCGLAGTVMRFLPVLAGLCKGSVEFFGDDQAIRRPMDGTLHALRKLGVQVDGDRIPFTVHGRGEIEGGALETTEHSSSQFISGLLLSACRFKNGLTLKHIGNPLPSRPYIDMTVEVMREWGINVTHSDGVWAVTPKELTGKHITIEPDLSNAAPFMIGALVTGGSATIQNWPSKTSQPGKYLEAILPQFGAEITKTANTITVSGTGNITGIRADLGHIGELVPNLVALATLAETPSVFYNIGHIRYHETDRIEALVNEISSLGGTITAGKDYIKITPTTLTRSGVWKTYKDHRMATSGAIIGLRHKLTIEDIECTSKTFPRFADLWSGAFGK